MKDIPTSPRIALLKRNRRVKRLRLLILSTLLFASVVFALSYFSSNPKIIIDKILITGNSIIDQSDLESTVRKNLSGKYIGIFSRSNFLIYPHDRIYNDLKALFPRIESLSIKREGFNTVNIVIIERSGSYLYCGKEIPSNKEDIGENCYFINNDGYIFDKAPYFSGDVYFKFYTNISEDVSDPLGVEIFSKEKFHELVRFMDGVVSLGFKPSYFVITSDGLSSLYLQKNASGINPKIIFKQDNDIAVIMDNFKTAMGEKEFANEINSKYDTLLYIDLRFKNKVLYKFN